MNPLRSHLLASVLPLVVLCSWAATSTAGSGLDPGYGKSGKVETGFGNNAIPQSAALQSDGKLVVVGTIDDFDIATRPFHVVRYLTSGNLDTGFGSGGSLRIAFTNFLNTASAVAIQSDGKIVVAGNTQSADGTLNEFAVARLTTRGALDPGFGTGGRVQTDFFGPPPHPGGVREAADVVLIQPDGKILVGGMARTSSKRVMKTALAWYNANGTLDPTFGSGGLATDSLIGNVNALALRANGHILAANAAGNVEEFAANGARIGTPATGAVTARAHTGVSMFQPDGNVVIASTVGGGSYRRDTDVRVTRQSPPGATDPAFVSSPFDFSTATQVASAPQNVALASGGAIVVGGMSSPISGGSMFGVARLRADGGLDAGFGNGGRLTTTFTNSEQVIALVVQSDGKVIAVGQTFSSTTQLTDIALARYLAPAAALAAPGSSAERGLERLAVGNSPAYSGPITIEFTLDRAVRVSADVFDPSGRRVRSLANESFAAGVHRLTWDGTDDRRQPLAPGMYFAHIEPDGGTVSARKLVLAR